MSRAKGDGRVPRPLPSPPPPVRPVLQDTAVRARKPRDVWALGFHLRLLGILETLGRQPGARRA